MAIYDVTLDAIGNPDQLTVKQWCRKIRIQQKDLDAATLLPFRVYVPDNSASYEYVRIQTYWERDFQQWLPPGFKFAQAETVSSSATFVQIES